MKTLEEKTSNELAVDRTNLAAARTLMGAERSLMAWDRTALSTIGFGFTLYKVLEGFQQAGGLLPKAETPRNAGLFLVAMGTFAMVLGIIEYWQALRSLRDIRYYSPWRPSLVIAMIMATGGVLFFVSILIRLV